MNPKRKYILTTALLLTILLMVTYGLEELTRPAPSPENAVQAAYKAQAEKIFEDAVREVEKIRNATLPQVDLEVVTRQWSMDTWGRGGAQPDVQNIQREERIYKGLFMMSENESLYQAQVDWAGNFGAVTWNGKIYVVQENFDPWNMPYAEATFVHELTHILQGQFSIPSPAAHTFDVDKARTALIEGDASYMGDFFLNQTEATASLASASTAHSALLLEGNPLPDGLHASLPDTISHLDYFPYDYGKPFVKGLYGKGGWAAVYRAYANPPNTTEQILHPEKYLLNETPHRVAASRPSENDWNQVKNDAYGEYFVQDMLGNWLPQDTAQSAAAGWNGDNLTLYEGGAQYLFTWNIGWDSSNDALEFFRAFHSMMNATGAAKENADQWSANGRYLSIEWNQTSNSTLIAYSTIQTAVEPSYFN